MAYTAKVILDSLSSGGARLTTMELTYPRFIHSEFMTHRMLSRNAASSRAIPISKVIERIESDPVEPVWFGKNQPGMQADEEMSPEEKVKFLGIWHTARRQSTTYAKSMLQLGAHKQIVNRILEPWMWMTVIVSGTEWNNMFNLRTDRLAQPEFKHIADMACEAYHSSEPTPCQPGDWHTPLIKPEDVAEVTATSNSPVESSLKLRNISVARCARVSYLTHDGVRSISEDLTLFERLSGSGHWSPFEHVACSHSDPSVRSGNFRGWIQYRKYFPQENRERFDFEAWKARREGAQPV